VRAVCLPHRLDAPGRDFITHFGRRTLPPDKNTRQSPSPRKSPATITTPTRQFKTILPPDGILASHRYYEPLRHPKQPNLTLTSCWLILNIQNHCWGFPCCVWSPSLTCRRHYPGRSNGTCSLVPLRRHRPSPECWRVGTCIALFEACSAFTRVTACTLAESPSRPSTPKASTVSLPLPLLRLLPGGANQFPGGFVSRC
jgi:hypothetical protein